MRSTLVGLIDDTVQLSKHLPLPLNQQAHTPQSTSISIAHHVQNSEHHVALSLLLSPLILPHPRCRLLGRMVWAM